MVSLPLDLLPHLLAPLHTADLESCSLVTRDFYQVARQLQFSKLVLCSKTWRAKCRFLLDKPGSHLLKHVKNLTLRNLDMPVFINGAGVPSLLISLLRKLKGHCTKSFCVESLSQEHPWSDLHSTFRETVMVYLLPHVSSLHLLGVTRIPLLTIIRQCPLVMSIELSAQADHTTTDVDTREQESPCVSDVTSLSMGVFGESDFSTKKTLGKYILLAGAKITSLELRQHYSNDHFFYSLSFLNRFKALAQQLLHLSLGPQLYAVIVSGKDRAITLNMFPQLQTLELSLLVEHDDDYAHNWAPWSEWVVRLLNSDSNHPRSLLILRFLLKPGGERRQRTALDELAAVSNFQIHVCVGGCAGNVRLCGETVSSVRGSLNAWDTAGKLKFWMRL
ncbi:hypothetical protein DL96DRAFT_1580673 [Flagelloscypha sp. PMI_526]|nr:hypothetical protein DL96DRAFT_1580673 [Flagelloscypha sp. PMI_526]